MPAERDPRIDPKPGDVLRRGKRSDRKVEYIGGLTSKKDHNPGVAWGVKRRTIRWVCMELWRRWAKDAEVIHHAGN